MCGVYKQLTFKKRTHFPDSHWSSTSILPQGQLEGYQWKAENEAEEDERDKEGR